MFSILFACLFGCCCCCWERLGWNSCPNLDANPQPLRLFLIMFSFCCRTSYWSDCCPQAALHWWGIHHQQRQQQPHQRRDAASTAGAVRVTVWQCACWHWPGQVCTKRWLLIGQCHTVLPVTLHCLLELSETKLDNVHINADSTK